MNDWSHIEHNLKRINQQISLACEQAEREVSEVRLLAASKRTDTAGVIASVSYGQSLFGENRAQSLRDKHDSTIATCPNAEWHFIGHLQKNKVKYIVGRATMIHSVDSAELALAISRRVMQQRAVGKQIEDIETLVQVKYGSEAAKTGCPAPQALELAAKLSELPGLCLKGLMLIPPLEKTPKHWFEKLALLAEHGNQQGLCLPELSMGMSSDLSDAIAAGSTIIRIGTAIYQR